jgi:hypothetical protein
LRYRLFGHKQIRVVHSKEEKLVWFGGVALTFSMGCVSRLWVRHGSTFCRNARSHFVERMKPNTNKSRIGSSGRIPAIVPDGKTRPS